MIKQKISEQLIRFTYLDRLPPLGKGAFIYEFSLNAATAFTVKLLTVINKKFIIYLLTNNSFKDIIVSKLTFIKR